MINNAWRNARAMYEKDSCARTMGIELIEMDDGFAQMTMTVSPDMLNGHQTCHGGQLFTLADTNIPLRLATQPGLAAGSFGNNDDFFARRLPGTGWSPPPESNSRAS